MASSVRRVEPPDYLRESGDVVDVLEDKTRGGREAVHDLINNAASRTVTPFVPTNSAHANVQNVEASQDARGRVVTKNEITLTPLSTAELMEQSDDISWHVEEILPTKSTMVVVAREGVGKTWMVLGSYHHTEKTSFTLRYSMEDLDGGAESTKWTLAPSHMLSEHLTARLEYSRERQAQSGLADKEIDLFSVEGLFRF